MKPLAIYLPQYHRIKENDTWWGEGYTEWTAVKNAIAYSKKQYQPKVPLDHNYYDLSDEEGKAWKWQAELSKKYNIYGFMIYHYWFETGKQLLEKPMEILLRHPEIDLNYCICWANESWRMEWYDMKNELLMEQKYGREDEWKNHFFYLLSFFKDKRYIKHSNKPVLFIYHTAEIEDLQEMLALWREMAINNGFDGMHIVAGNTGAPVDYRTGLFDAYYNFEPSNTLMHKMNKLERLDYLGSVFMRSTWNKYANKKIIERKIKGDRFVNGMYRADKIKDVEIYPCVFPQWDNTPRRKYKGTFFDSMDKEMFAYQIKKAKEKYNGSEYLLINAWNEWGEGAYLEPDEINRYDYLEVVSSAFNAQ